MGPSCDATGAAANALARSLLAWKPRWNANRSLPAPAAAEPPGLGVRLVGTGSPGSAAGVHPAAGGSRDSSYCTRLGRLYGLEIEPGGRPARLPRGDWKSFSRSLSPLSLGAGGRKAQAP